MKITELLHKCIVSDVPHRML